MTEMSPSRLQHLFKSETGGSLMAFVNRLRLEKAHQLLADPTCFLHIQEIAVILGFGDASRLCRGFRSKYGMSPRVFRRQQDNIFQSNDLQDNK